MLATPLPNVIELDVGDIGLKYQSGESCKGDNVPDITVLGPLTAVDSQVCKSIVGGNGQSRIGSSSGH